MGKVERRRRRRQTALVAQDVLDIFGADVAGAHHLGDGAGALRFAEQLDEQDQALRLARERAVRGGEDLEVAGAGFAQAVEAGRQPARGARLVLERSALVAGLFYVPPAAPPRTR